MKNQSFYINNNKLHYSSDRDYESLIVGCYFLQKRYPTNKAVTLVHQIVSWSAQEIGYDPGCSIFDNFNSIESDLKLINGTHIDEEQFALDILNDYIDIGKYCKEIVNQLHLPDYIKLGSKVWQITRRIKPRPFIISDMQIFELPGRLYVSGYGERRKHISIVVPSADLINDHIFKTMEDAESYIEKWKK